MTSKDYSTPIVESMTLRRYQRKPFEAHSLTHHLLTARVRYKVQQPGLLNPEPFLLVKE
jgi:hypothetical protein